MWGSTCHQEGDNDIMGILHTPLEVRIQQQVPSIIHFLFVLEIHYPFRAPPSPPHPYLRPRSPAGSTTIYPALITATLFGCSSRPKKLSKSMPSDAPGISRSEEILFISLARLWKWNSRKHRQGRWRQSNMERWLKGGGGTDEREYHSPPPQRCVPAIALRDHFPHHIHNQRTALTRGRRGADLSAALA